MQTLEALEHSLSLLENEGVVLKKLLYRNNNQHRKSKPHILMKTASRYVAMILRQSADIITLNRDVEKLTRSHNKLSVNRISESSKTLNGLNKTIGLLLHTMMWVEKAAKEIGGYVAQLVFLPLFTMYMAISARIHDILTELCQHHSKRLELFHGSLQSASIKFPHHCEKIQNILRKYALPEELKAALEINVNANIFHKNEYGMSESNPNHDLGEDIAFSSTSYSDAPKPKTECPASLISGGDKNIFKTENNVVACVTSACILKESISVASESPGAIGVLECSAGTSSEEIAVVPDADLVNNSSVESKRKLLEMQPISSTPTSSHNLSSPATSTGSKRKKKKKRQSVDDIDAIFNSLAS